MATVKTDSLAKIAKGMKSVVFRHRRLHRQLQRNDDHRLVGIANSSLRMDGFDWYIVGIVRSARCQPAPGHLSTVFLTYDQVAEPLMQAVNRWFPQVLMIRGPAPRPPDRLLQP